MEFDYTNNIAEYEALYLGIELTRDMGIKILKVTIDSDIVVMEVKGQFSTKIDTLKRYRHAVWDSVELFGAFSIDSIPQEQNMQSDVLAVIIQEMIKNMIKSIKR